MLDPPWSLRVQDQAPLTLVAAVRGTAYLVPDGGRPMRLAAGDVAVVRGPDPYTVADDPAHAPQIVIHPGQRCDDARRAPLAEAMELGVRTWGNERRRRDRDAHGHLRVRGRGQQAAARALPPLLVARRAARRTAP